MSDEEETPEVDSDEEKFWARMAQEQESALDRWAAKASAEIDEEEEKKQSDAKEKKDDPAPDGGGPDAERREPSAAERQWESGRSGAREAGFARIYKKWGRKALYGK